MKLCDIQVGRPVKDAKLFRGSDDNYSDDDPEDVSTNDNTPVIHDPTHKKVMIG